jgi:hypothetical protein
MTEITLQFRYFDMRFVLILDGLDRLAAETEKMTNRFPKGFVSGGENCTRTGWNGGVGLCSHHGPGCQSNDNYSCLPPPHL